MLDLKAIKLLANRGYFVQTHMRNILPSDFKIVLRTTLIILMIKNTLFQV